MNKYKVTINRTGVKHKVITHFFRSDEYEDVDISENVDMIISASSKEEARMFAENMIACLKCFKIPMYVIGGADHLKHKVVSVKKL